MSRNLMASTASAATTLPFTPIAHTSIVSALDPAVYVPTAMNDFGEVVGYTVVMQYLFKWQGSRGLKVDSTNPFCFPVSVNNHGEIAMECESGLILQDWFGHNRQLANLFHYMDPDPKNPEPFCLLVGVADNSAALGICGRADDISSYPAQWTPFGTPYPIFKPGTTTLFRGAGKGISHNGWMAGDDSVSGSAFVRSPTGAYHELPPFGISRAGPVNDSGWVAGVLTQNVPQSPGRNVAWLRNDSLAYLNYNGDPLGISNSGQIILNGGQLWTPRHLLTQLPPWQTGGNAGPIAINNSNQILGVTTANGKLVHVIWTLPPNY